MQNAGSKYFTAVGAILAVTACLWSARPANAVLFNFSATCTGPCDSRLGPDPSSVTGSLDLAATAVAPAANINGSDVLAFSLNFATLGPLNFSPAFFGPSGDPIGNMNLIGDAIERISIFDSMGQFFTFDATTEFGAASWAVLTFVNNEPIVGTGTNPTFPIAPSVTVPEPGTLAMFLFALASMALVARRRRRVPVLSANSRVH